MQKRITYAGCKWPTSCHLFAGDSSSDPTWAPSFEGSAVGCSASMAAATEDDGQEASSALRELPRGSADRAGASVLRESRSESAPGRWAGSEAARNGVLGFLRAVSEPRTTLDRGDHPRFAVLAGGTFGGAEAGTEDQAESDGPGGRTGFWGAFTCRDDREFDENVNEEGGETGALAGESSPFFLLCRKPIFFC